MSLISVYIPTHNRSGLLGRAIDSVLNQTYKNTEIIIVDDGSSDDTSIVLESYSSKYNNIIHLKHDVPKGACAARNYAISTAKGKYITGLDDDDEFLPTHLEGLLNAFDENYAFVASSLLENNGKGLIKRSLDCGIISLDSLLHYNKVGNQVFTLTSRMQKINGFDEAFPAFQDYDTWIRLVYEFGPCKKIEQATYVWHTSHEQNRITNDNSKRLLALKLFLQKHRVKMTKSHVKSNYIRTAKIERRRINFFDLLKNINKFNYKPAIALYVNANFPLLGAKWRSIKEK